MNTELLIILLAFFIISNAILASKCFYYKKRGDAAIKVIHEMTDMMLQSMKKDLEKVKEGIKKENEKKK